jgi:hypothetical protein
VSRWSLRWNIPTARDIESAPVKSNLIPPHMLSKIEMPDHTPAEYVARGCYSTSLSPPWTTGTEAGLDARRNCSDRNSAIPIQSSYSVGSLGFPCLSSTVSLHNNRMGDQTPFGTFEHSSILVSVRHSCMIDAVVAFLALVDSNQFRPLSLVQTTSHRRWITMTIK